MKKILTGRDIIKSYKENAEAQKVLDCAFIEIEQGEFAAVMGASGSGKSTLLYALSGMDSADSGEICFDEENLAALPDSRLADIRREKMGFVFQQPTMLKNLNILDNIILPQMRNNRKNARQLVKKAEALMGQVGIEMLAPRSIAQVSGGQLQRAGICRALINSPKILFADEPTGALNSKASDEIMNIFSAIHQQGTAILLVTHDAKVAARAQRVLFMQDGKIISQLVFTATDCKLSEKTEKILTEAKRLGI